MKINKQHLSDMFKRSIVLCPLMFIFLTISGQIPEKQGALGQLFSGPARPGQTSEWMDSMLNWRNRKITELNFSDSEYHRPEFQWLRGAFTFVQMMAHDRYFYDYTSGNYTVSKYLSDLENRYGGIDAVLIWPTYPNMGIDDRNQFDLTSDMPGGREKLKQVIRDFHKHGVRVFFPIMKWDNGTRKIDLTMSTALTMEMKELGADGLNGDTFLGIPLEYKKAYDSLHYPLVLQSEVTISDLKELEWNTSSWGYFWNYLFTPGVSIDKWLEPMHHGFVTNRWMTNRTDDLQHAFFNGMGYNPWENIWDIWNEVSPRNGEEIRRIGIIYRAFPDFWSSSEWTPFFPVLQQGIFSSRFSSGGNDLFTFINRSNTDRIGSQIKLPMEKGTRYFDLWNGVELLPEIMGDSVNLKFEIEGLGYGALLVARGKDIKLQNVAQSVISKMRYLSKRSLSSYSNTWEAPAEELVFIENTAPASVTPPGMVAIPGDENYLFESTGTMIEGNDIPKAVGIQYPWQDHPSRSTEHRISVKSFYMDQYPVTNKEFKKFIDETHYRPTDDHNFLKDWENGSFKKGWANKPVTWVSIEDARAYAKWAGKRLPHEWEWQYAAQGGVPGKKYPWGERMDYARIPPLDSSRHMRPPTDVNAYPQGASAFGVVDMVGNIWQWTDEYIGQHTRAAVLKGGGYYRPNGSHWYFPRAFEVNKYGKYLLMAPSLDRSGSIGFRCVKDK